MESATRPGTAMVFPGMGPARFADVGKFMLLNPQARRLVAAADARLGYSLVDRFRETPGDYSEYAQVAFLVNCLALAEWAERELGVAPEVCVGASFGVKTAIAHAGALPFEDAVWMTAALARRMDEYFATEHQDVVTHSFVRTPGERVSEALEELRGRGEWCDVSCHVDHDFYMVTLRERNVEWLDRKVRAMGGLTLYTMRPPMHSPAFEGLRRAAEEEVLAELDFAHPTLPLVADHDGRVVRSAEEVRAMLLDGFVRPLRWPTVVAALRDLGIGTVCVAGQDSLFSRVACTRENFEVVAAGPQLALRPRRRGAGVP